MADSLSSKYYSETKVIKLKTHPRNFCEEDLVVNLDSFIKEKFRIFEGIVIEIFPVDERKSFGRKNHLLLEVRKIPADVQAKGGPLSISKEVAHAFNLNGLKEVCIRRVDKDEVALDLVEFRFKDQGLSRSDMWRFTNSLIDKGMYISRKLLFAGMLLKVSGLWAKGETVKSGVVTDSTRIVFRSASSQFFLFIQVSSEIWEFDPNGDTYFDKAVDGFLKDLFSVWKDKECNHQLTLIFFARKYSKNYTDGMLTDKHGRYYTDYYYVVVQEESRSDWSSAIVEVKRSFQCFQELLNPQTHLINGDGVVPEQFDEWISISAEGNILEATNLAVNVLENHYKNCNFNTTGQQIVIVSPGAGVFEVDNELNRLTKERIIDQGIGMDLICLNEQPLHAVPLFKFYSGYHPEDRYHIPHWINYSYYNPSRPWTQFRYQPRIKISDHLVNKHLKANPVFLDKTGHCSQKAKHTCAPPLLNPNDPLALIDYETYDSNIFAFSGSSKYHNFSEDYPSERPKLGRYSTFEDFSASSYEHQSSSPSEVPKVHASARKRPQRARHHSDNYEDEIFDDGLVRVGSAEMVGSFISTRQPFRPLAGRRKKAFINPFDPSKSHVEVNSHLCRWMHTFPRDTMGRAFQTHHVKELEKLDENTELKTKNRLSTSSSLSTSIPTEPLSVADTIQASTVESFASIRRSGMDWTSLMEPACLPLTTDYYPDNYAISRDYVVYNSSLLVSSDDSEGAGDKGVADGWRADHQNINTVQAFKEMISQRLAQGFQLVFHYGSLYSLHKDLDGLKKNKKKKKTIIVKFSMGRVFQNITLEFPHMHTCIYKMKTPIHLKEIQYCYKLVSNARTLSDASCGLAHERRENYNWNYLDQHISGHVDFEQYQESHKYWRCRFLVLPSEAPPSDRTGESMSSWLCDITSGFIRLVELMNSIKRTSPAIKNQKRDYGRFNSMPCRSPSIHSTTHTSPCPSPTVSLPRQRSREDLSTPSRSNSDSKMKSHDDLRSPGTRSPDLHVRSPVHHEQLLSSKSPQLSLVSSNSQRSSREIVGDLKELTFGSRQRSTSPNPQRLRRKLKTASIENLPTAHEEETQYPSLCIVPSTPTRIPSNDDDDLSPLDFPDAPLMIGSPPEKVLQALLDRNDGIDLIVNQPPLRNNSFLSMEAVKLLQEKMDGSTRRDIVTMMQNMLKKGHIVHASGDKRVPFIDGFYFYYAPESSNIEEADIEYEVFCKKWFEVGINPIKQETEANTPSHGSSFQSSPYYMHSSDYDKALGDGSSRFVEFNPDQQSISDRPEWCYIHYRTMYYQTQGYPLEFQWMACTLSLLHKLVQNWTHKAAMCGFNLVPVHSLGVLGLVESTNDQPHPFLNSVVLSFQLPSEYQVYLNDLQDDHSVFLINLFQLILDKLGFLLDPTSLMELGSPDYYWKPQLSTVLSSVFIHHTGVAIVQPLFESKAPGFKWLANNYYLQQKSTSQSVLNKYDELIETFKTLLTNTEELLILCNKAKQDY